MNQLLVVEAESAAAELTGLLIDQYGAPLAARAAEGEIVERAIEGAYRPGPWVLPLTGGILPSEIGQYINWWQMGYDPVSPHTSAIVEACVSAYAQAIAMCPCDHWRRTAKGGRERVTTSAVSRILRNPNDYQSASDVMLNVVWSLQGSGNSHALALRNSRFEVDEIHLMPRGEPRIAQNGAIFYELGGNEIVDRRLDLGGDRFLVPARDVWHVKQRSQRGNPLVGVSPLQAAAMNLAMGNVALQQQITFYLNQARPSYVLTTDKVLNSTQIDLLRSKWNEHAQGLNQGKTPILSAGLKPNVLSVTAKDAELAEILKLSDQAIANVYRVPLQILGIGSLPFSSTEALMQFWLANGLSFMMNHIENSLGDFFGLKGYPDEYIAFDRNALLGSDLAARIGALAAGIKGGIYTNNEARGFEDLPEVEGGDIIRVQQQDRPISQDPPPEQLEPPPQADEEEEEDEEPAPEPPPTARIDNDAIRRTFRAAYNAGIR